MGLEYDRKRLAEKQKKYEQYTREIADLSTKQAEKAGEARKAQQAADQFAKQVKEVERKANPVAAEVKRLQDRIAKTETAQNKRAAS